jgi:hypothetical protein
MTGQAAVLLKAFARAMAAQAALLDAHADALLTEAADVRADAPAAAPCPHHDEDRIDLATLAHPYRFACRACGVTINDVRQEVSDGSSHR